MPTDKPIITLAIDEELRNRVSDFRFDNRINTQSEAIRILIEEGLMRVEEQAKKKASPQKGVNISKVHQELFSEKNQKENKSKEQYKKIIKDGVNQINDILNES